MPELVLFLSDRADSEIGFDYPLRSGSKTRGTEHRGYGLTCAGSPGKQQLWGDSGIDQALLQPPSSSAGVVPTEEILIPGLESVAEALPFQLGIGWRGCPASGNHFTGETAEARARVGHPGRELGWGLQAPRHRVLAP